jgi:hypothetical protein
LIGLGVGPFSGFSFLLSCFLLLFSAFPSRSCISGGVSWFQGVGRLGSFGLFILFDSQIIIPPQRSPSEIAPEYQERLSSDLCSFEINESRLSFVALSSVAKLNVHVCTVSISLLLEDHSLNSDISVVGFLWVLDGVGGRNLEWWCFVDVPFLLLIRYPPGLRHIPPFCR